MSARDSVGLTALGPIMLQDRLSAGYFPFSNSQLFLAMWNTSVASYALWQFQTLFSQHSHSRSICQQPLVASSSL